MSETIVTGKYSQRKLQKRKLDVNFQLVSGGFGPDGKDNLTLSGHRVSAHITHGGMASGSSMSLRIEGMSLSYMNRLSVIRSRQTWQNANRITLYGGDGSHVPVDIFSGYITSAFVDFSGAPNVAFQVEASNLSLSAAKILPPISFSGSVAFETIASIICNSMGWTLINHGVKSVFSSYYGYGDPRSALEKLCLSVKAIFHLDEKMNALHVWPFGYSYIADDADKDMPYISSKSGLIGYPAYSDAGVLFQCLFNPYIKYYSPVKLHSDYSPAAWVNNQNGQLPSTISPASGVWLPYIIEHTLETEMPDGQWQTFVGAVRGDNPFQFRF
ncbi:MAG: hypothetical protein ABF611_08020 [Acetobacter orientalis]|uniref:baseplate hub protein n=1 Tax=Acetobacter orientalis TaxID=146474 RepID=UPI0039E99A23